MKIPDWIGGVLFVIASILGIAVVFFVYQAHFDCKDSGGVLVKTLEGGVCIKQTQ